MFLSRRSTQEEYFDSDRPAVEVRQFFHSLARVNRLFDFAEPFRNVLTKFLGQGSCEALSILDLGAGDGMLGRSLSRWAAQRRWNWRITNLDTNLAALALNGEGLNVAASATRLPFKDGSFDVVVASQMTHHLSDPQVKELLREAWRVTRQAVFVCDLHRNAALYLLLRLLFLLQRHPSSFQADGLLSVRRGWRVGELRKLAQEAAIPGGIVKLHFGARVILQAHKPTSGAGNRTDEWKPQGRGSRPSSQAVRIS